MSENDNENVNETEAEEIEAEVVESEEVESEDVTDAEELIDDDTSEVQSEDNNPSDADADAELHDVAPMGNSANVNLETLLKVPVNLSIEVGRTQLALNEVLDTREGTVIELERRLDQPLDILVNGSLVAHGVVVLANDRFGIQITDIVSLQERAQNL